MYFLPHKKAAQCRGFTFVEMLVVVAVTALLVVAISNVVVDFYTYNSYTIAQTSELREARRGMRTLVRDIREMTFADNGQFPLVETSSTSVLFFSDVDHDDSVELVRYELSTTTLYKYIYNAVGTEYSTTTPDETFILSTYVQNEIEATPIFRYYDLNGDEATSTTSIADVRYISLDVIINVDLARNPDEFTLHSSAALRNIIETY